PGVFGGDEFSSATAADVGLAITPRLEQARCPPWLWGCRYAGVWLLLRYNIHELNNRLMKAALTALWIAYGLLATGLPHVQDWSFGATDLHAGVVPAAPRWQGAEEPMRPVGILAGTTLDDARAATSADTCSVLRGL